MRRRLLISMIAVAVAAVLALGTPLAFVLRRLQLDEVSQSLHRDAQQAATTLYQRYTIPAPINAEQVARRVPNHSYVVIKENGNVIYRAGRRPPPHSFRAATDTVGPFTVTVDADNAYLSGELTGELLLIGGVAATRARSAAGTAFRSWTGSLRGWTALHSGSTICSRPSGTSPWTPHISSGPR
jgi:hypothetical protein